MTKCLLVKRRRSRLSLKCLLVVTVSSALGRPEPLAHLEASAGGPSVRAAIADVARMVIEAPQIGEAQLSPDGTYLLYTVSRPSVVENQVVTELLVQEVGRSDAIRGAVIIERSVRSRGVYLFAARWCPDGSCVTYMAPSADSRINTPGALFRYDLRLQRSTPVLVRDQQPNRSSGEVGTATRSVGRDYKWAPSGDSLAFTAPLESAHRTRPQTGVRIEGALLRSYELAVSSTPKRGLFVLDSKTGRIEQISANSLSVRSFDWAPNSQELAVAAIRNTDVEDELASTDLFVLDRATHRMREVLTQPGNDGHPFWSPNGQWIAIESAFGNAQGNTSLGVIPATGGRVIRFTGVDLEQLSPETGGDVFWMPDSQTFYYSTAAQMSRQLHVATIATARISSLRVDEGLAVESLRVSPDRRWLTFVRSGQNVPPELCIRALPNGRIRQLTQLSPGFALTSQVNTERVSWSSSDSRFTVHGILLTPRPPEAANGERASKAALPTIVYIQGGPSMVEASYDHAHPEVLALAQHGYAVLVPNTRGRNGYGSAYAYREGYPDPVSYARVPYDDVIAGVEYLVRRGIADRQRLGIMGHSYGGYVTSYTVTQTNQFRGAVFYEGAGVQMVLANMEYLPKSGAEIMNRLMGVQNPFDPGEMAKLIAVSPAFNMHCVATPMLLMFGEQTRSKQRNAYLLFSGLQRFGVPVELILYDEGHVIELPTAKVDAVTRIVAWFDYWVRDAPYGDEALGRMYDSWRDVNVSKRSLPSPCAAGQGSTILQ